LKIGIISDIHANLAALRAVLQALEDEACTKIICAGDVVGYGASPLECIQLLQEKRIPCIQGNHDAWVAEGIHEWGVSKEAAIVVEWTRKLLPPDALDWLRKLPRTYQYANFEVCHGSLAWRPYWGYVLHNKALLTHLLFQRASVCFHGHTHLPVIGMHAHGEHARMSAFTDITVPPGHRVLVNVGSVGQPRDKNPQASCGIYEIKERRIRPLRIAYDIAETQALMKTAGIPERLITRLDTGT
jgi:predicted phosphodiesterase